MTSPPRLASACAIVVPLGAGWAAGCRGSGATCDCADPAIAISVPADIASSVIAVNLSGPACANASASPANQANGGTEYTFTAGAAGTCTIEVIFASGDVFEDELTILEQSGCCPGFYVSPPGAAQVDVPEPDASVAEAGEAG